MYDLTLIGYGIAHMALLLALSRHRPLKVCVIDPYFDGGDLRRLYGSVHSNTTWQQFLDAVEPYLSKVKYAALAARHEVTATVPLADLVYNFESICPDDAAKVSGTVVAANYTEGEWTLTLSGGRKVKSKVISFSPGADPKALTYPKPVLYLPAVLSDQVHIRPESHCVVFGLSHSGTLAVDRLSGRCTKVTAVYRTAEPFEFAADGHYTGIKQESATIGRRILEGAYSNVEVVPAADHEKLFGALLSADWIVYAIGFEGRHVTINWTVDGVQADAASYDATNGKLTLPSAFGFGIAYPNSNTVRETTYYDVSLAAFIAHCERAVPAIVELM
jgi:hypothetical protein